jgi:hypothetical protein
MPRPYGSTRSRLGPLAWLALYSAGCLAAEAAVQAVTGRTIETLPALTWWLAIGYSFAGWIMANLKNAVVAMNGPDDKFVAGASVISTFIAAHLVGINGKPIPPLIAYFTGAVGAAGGMAFINIGIDAFKAAALRWAGGGNMEDRSS